MTVLHAPPSTHAGRRSSESVHSKKLVDGQVVVVEVGVVVAAAVVVVGVVDMPQLLKLPPSQRPTMLFIPPAIALQAVADFTARNCSFLDSAPECPAQLSCSVLEHSEESNRQIAAARVLTVEVHFSSADGKRSNATGVVGAESPYCTVLQLMEAGDSPVRAPQPASSSLSELTAGLQTRSTKSLAASVSIMCGLYAR